MELPFEVPETKTQEVPQLKHDNQVQLSQSNNNKNEK